MRGTFAAILLLAISGTPAVGSDDGPDPVIHPVLLTSSELNPKLPEQVRFPVKLLYKEHISTEGVVDRVELLLCAARHAGEKQFTDASKEVCDPIDKEIRVALLKRKYRPATRYGKAVEYESVVKVDLLPRGQE